MSPMPIVVPEDDVNKSARLNLVTTKGDPLLHSVEDAYAGNALPMGRQREAGAILANGVQIASTMQCVHCNAHFMVKAGSGIERGWCHHCGGPHCGAKCAVCRPFFKQLEDIERKATLDTRYGG